MRGVAIFPPTRIDNFSVCRNTFKVANAPETSGPSNTAFALDSQCESWEIVSSSSKRIVAGPASTCPPSWMSGLFTAVRVVPEDVEGWRWNETRISRKVGVSMGGMLPESIRFCFESPAVTPRTESVACVPKSMMMRCRSPGIVVGRMTSAFPGSLAGAVCGPKGLRSLNPDDFECRSLGGAERCEGSGSFLGGHDAFFIFSFKSAMD
mmetsp:Transcript_5516/g.8407  ORF Transcript_5516/g.8407 Transcript_5516/m.8407 type:complete len:208 (-) Transcript_5516:1436-2059(-)